MGYRTNKSKIKEKRYKTGNYTEFYYHFFKNILLVSIPLVIISALILGFCVPHSSAEGGDITASDSFTVSISSSCTIRSNIEDAHVINVNAGSYTSELGSTKINTYCNDNNGYSIYAIGSSNNVDGNTDLVSNINDNYNISTGLYNSSTITPSSPSTWSMKLTAGTGTGINPDTGASVALTPPNIVNGFNNYSLVPSTYTLVASRSSATDLSSNTDVTGSYFTTTYDIYASSYQPAGTYSGKVKYLILHPQSNINTIPDIDAAFAIAGKQKQANVIDPITGQTGNFYRMQDMTTDICNSVSNNGERTSTQLVDIRDNKLYWVTKLKDGHCWMTQNLDLDFAQTTYTDSQGQQITIIKPLTSNDTDLTDHSLSGAYVDGYTYDDETGINTWVPATSTKTIDFEGATLSGWNASYVTPYSASKTDDNGMGHNSLGNYYSWSAIIASNNSSSLTGGNANNSICPKNWRLPTVSSQPASDIGSTNEFARLNYIYNDNSAVSDANLIISPLWFVRGGQIEGNNLTAASYGKYWSSTVNGDFFASLLSFGSDNVSPSQVYDRYRSTGRTIRCLAR